MLQLEIEDNAFFKIYIQSEDAVILKYKEFGEIYYHKLFLKNFETIWKVNEHDKEVI